LNNEIAIKIGWNPHSQNKHRHYGIPQLIKNALANFKDIKISHSGFSSSSKLIESLLFAQVKDAIILLRIMVNLRVLVGMIFLWIML